MKYVFILINIIVLVFSKVKFNDEFGILNEEEKKKIVELSHTITIQNYFIVLRLADFKSLIENDLNQEEYFYNNQRFFYDNCLELNCNRTIVISYFYLVNVIKVKFGEDVKINNLEDILKNINQKKYNSVSEACYSFISSIVAQIPYDIIITQNNKNLILGVLIFLIVVFIFYVYRSYSAQTIESFSIIESNISEETIHSHVEKLLNLATLTLKESQTSIDIEYCIICMGYLNPNFLRDERNGVTNSNIFLTQFNCSHMYHSSCLSKKNISGCIVCLNIESKQKYIIPKFRYYSNINSSNIKNLLERLNLMYNKRQLEDYYKFYKSDFQQIKKIFPSYDKNQVFNYQGTQYSLIEMRSNNKEDY